MVQILPVGRSIHNNVLVRLAGECENEGRGRWREIVCERERWGREREFYILVAYMHIRCTSS